MRNIISQKKMRMRKKTKKESQKKKTRNHFSRHRKNKTWKLNVKRCPTKKGNRQNREFWEQKKTEKKGVLQKFTRKQIVKKVLDTENQETTKDKGKRHIFKRRKMVKEPRKHGETTNGTCGQRMKKGGNEEVKETFQKGIFFFKFFWMGKVKR